MLGSGAGLALHLGHRISRDLEFFTQRVFRPSDVLEELRALAGAVEPVTMESTTMTVVADGAHLSLRQHPVRFLEPTTRVNGCDVAGVIDIAAMKLLAVGREGSRSDFADLYAVLQTIPFRRVARNALVRYGAFAVEALSVGRGLVWFQQADAEADPAYVGTSIPWDRIKDYFRSSLRQLVFDLDAERKSLEQR
jgi:hypothetical protein